ncbi:MAG: nucleoside deaminase [Chloroflexi bacterium]|nr:nucleoside deaminase [Chloroflexota bacterium]
MTVEHDRFMRLALDEARLAEREGNAPVGCVIVRDGQVIARGHNLVYTTFDVTAHGETVALRNAGKAVGTVEFPGATLYTTFEPCSMCLSAMILARIGTLVLGGKNRPGGGRYSVESFMELNGWKSRLTVVSGVLQEQGETIFND